MATSQGTLLNNRFFFFSFYFFISQDSTGGSRRRAALDRGPLTIPRTRSRHTTSRRCHRPRMHEYAGRMETARRQLHVAGVKLEGGACDTFT